MPEPGVRVAGAEDVDAAEPAHPLPVREHDERPGRAGGGRGRQEGEPPVVCVQQREIMRITPGCLCSELS